MCNTPAGNDSRDDRPATRSLRPPAVVHSTLPAIPSAFSPLRSWADGKCARTDRLAPSHSVSISRNQSVETQRPLQRERIGQTLIGRGLIGRARSAYLLPDSRLENQVTSWDLLQFVASNPSVLSLTGLHSVPVSCRDHYQNFGAR